MRPARQGAGASALAPRRAGGHIRDGRTSPPQPTSIRRMQRREFLRTAAALPLLAGLPRAARLPRNAAPLRANGARVNAALAAFDSVGRTAGGINRVAYSEADLAGRAFTLDLFRQAGLAPRVDAAGNIVARGEGSARGLAPLVIGSHVDSVTDGGNYDGPVGSFAAIEVARSLREQRVRLRHPLEVVVWQNEEGGTVGSKAAVGTLTPEALDRTARSGVTIREGIRRIGGDVARLAEVARRPGDVAGYLELHIEQGGQLEAAALRIGVVQGIVGIRWIDVTVTGFANHAGATEMTRRQDALLAAAKFTVAVNDAVRAEPGRQVATVGRLVATPNTTNVIAGEVKLTVDLRDIETATLERFRTRFETLGREIGAQTGTTFAVASLFDSEPALADPRMMDVVESSAGALGLSARRMPSGAGHDAQEIARIAPMGMIFVPSVGGISHSPREYTKPEDVAAGVDVLLNAVVEADRRLG
jgi:beta-ureidopropionase / N-carbamoyl-L-amino-acid hydrolase